MRKTALGKATVMVLLFALTFATRAEAGHRIKNYPRDGTGFAGLAGLDLGAPVVIVVRSCEEPNPIKRLIAPVWPWVRWLVGEVR